MKNKTVVFDLDDTLISEYEYLESAYMYIAKYLDCEDVFLYKKMIQMYLEGINVFDYLIEVYDVTKEKLLELYRYHKPSIHLQKGALEVLEFLSKERINIGLITDGRSITQRNKLEAVGIICFFSDIIISEEFGFDKSTLKNFEFFHKYESEKYYYIADNLNKDFINPNLLNWETICLLDDGQNIHKQNFNLKKEYLPKYSIHNLEELITILNKK